MGGEEKSPAITGVAGGLKLSVTRSRDKKTRATKKMTRKIQVENRFKNKGLRAHPPTVFANKFLKLHSGRKKYAFASTDMDLKRQKILFAMIFQLF